MEFKKGLKLKVTQFNKGWDSEKMEKADDVQEVTVNKVIRRNSKTFVKVVSEYGYGFTLIPEEFKNGKIEMIG